MEEVNNSTRYLTMNELRKKLRGRSRQSIYNDIEAERLPKPFKMGKTLLWLEADIDAAIQQKAA